MFLIYLYDETGTPYAFTYNGVKYYYEYNLMGDVIGLFNSTGTRVVRYYYTPYGALASMVDNTDNYIGSVNPIRFRGYYYDTETGFYYCNSRYYDPEIGRWVNADDVSMLGANGDVNSYNLYAYCSNNPINYTDPSGNYWETALDVASLVVSYYKLDQNPRNLDNWAAFFADMLCLALPVATGGGTAVRLAGAADDLHDAGRAIDALSDTGEAINKGWRVGDDIDALTKAGNIPSWSTVRQRYWKNEAFYSAAHYSDSNLARLKKGLAPIGDDGFSMELHHPFGREGVNFYIFKPFTQTKHRSIHYGRRY